MFYSLKIKRIHKPYFHFSFVVPDSHIRRFRILFPGKALIADTRVKRQVFKPLDLDLDKIFAKKKTSEKIHETPTASTELGSNYNDSKEVVSDVNQGTGGKLDQAVQVNIADSKIYCDKAVQVDFEPHSLELQPIIDQDVIIDVNNNSIEAEDVEKAEVQECRKQDQLELMTIVDDVKVHVPGERPRDAKGIIGVKSDSEILDQNWLKDLLIGNFPRLKETAVTEPQAIVSINEAVPKTGEKKNSKSIVKRFRLRLKRMFGKDSKKDAKKTEDTRL